MTEMLACLYFRYASKFVSLFVTYLRIVIQIEGLRGQILLQDVRGREAPHVSCEYVE